MTKKLIDKIESNKAKIAVVGLGYVGLPLFLEFLDDGFLTAGIDTDPQKIQSLIKRKSYISDISDGRLKSTMDPASTHYRITTDKDVEGLQEFDVFIITVPTPVRNRVLPDMSYVHGAVKTLVNKVLRDRSKSDSFLIVLESTVYPGATRELVAKMYEYGLDHKFVIGHNFHVAFSPERVDPGNKRFTTKNTPKLVGGVTNKCTEVASKLYKKVIDTVITTESADVAEFSKVYENCFRAVNIALANEMAIAADGMCIDINEVIRAAGTKPFGFMKFTPGPGVGGHCIPLDPVYLSYIIKQHMGDSRLIDTALDINSKMPNYIVKRIVEILAENEKPIYAAKVLLLGLTYKKNVNDCRESPSKDIYKALLHDHNVKVCFVDPYVDGLCCSYQKVNLTHSELAKHDLVVFLVDHDHFDPKYILNHAKLVFDTKGFFDPKHPKVISL